MPKRIVYTKITPLPSNVPRQLALDMLHSHGEIISLNPLVTNHRPISAPRDAARDEYFAQWYEIEEVITWGLGMRKKIVFKGVFHDTPAGLQTHIYAPMGVDLRNKYTIAGNQPGEPKTVKELGVDAPEEGLYLREDVEISCNIALASFVKKETKQTLLTMIERMTKKAELLDDGVLQAMFQDGRLKTYNPLISQPGDALSFPSNVSLRAPSISSSPSSPLQSHFEGSLGHTFTKYSNLPGRTTNQRSSFLAPQELDTRPGSGASSLPQPFADAVEMEGSTAFITAGDAKSGAPVLQAELADTSTPYDVRRPSAQSTTSGGSLDAANSSLQPTASFNSQRSTSQQPSSASSIYSQNAVPGLAQQRPSDVSFHTRVPSNSSSSYVITNPDRQFRTRTPSARSNASYEGQPPAVSPAQPQFSQRQQPAVSPAQPQYSQRPQPAVSPAQTQYSPRQQPAASPIQAVYPHRQQPTASPPQRHQVQRTPPDVYQPTRGDQDALTAQVIGLAISGATSTREPTVESAGSATTAINCPICGVFEGDPAAVSHHVNRWHPQ